MKDFSEAMVEAHRWCHEGRSADGDGDAVEDGKMGKRNPLGYHLPLSLRRTETAVHNLRYHFQNRKGGRKW